MLDTVMSAGSTSSQVSGFSRKILVRSLADELDGAFEDTELDLTNTLDLTESPNSNYEGVVEVARRVEMVVASPTSTTFVKSDKQFPVATIASIVAPSQPPRKSSFVEHSSPTNSISPPPSLKDDTKIMASKHNRDLIERNPDGFFKMETMPSVADEERRIQQSQGIAALQRTLVAATLPDAAPSNSGGFHASWSKYVDSGKRPSNPRQITFAEPRDRKPRNTQNRTLHAASRSKAVPRFSLARHLIAAGHKKRLSEPSAPLKFVRLPSDPVVNFKRNFAERGLKISIPEPERNNERRDSGSVTSIPDVDSAGNLTFKDHKPKFEFGTPREFIADQCFESSCPIRWAHPKGPYHHKGQRSYMIMTGLFGHSNPPPEIWNAYRNMVQISRDGEPLSPDGISKSKADEDLVVAFAIFHFGGFNGISGEEFHRLFAGKHISSRIPLQSDSTSSLQSDSTISSTMSIRSCLGRRK